MLNDHIHLGLTLTGTPEFAPLYKFAVVYPNYQPIPSVMVGLKRGQLGKLFLHRLQSGGTTIKFKDYRLTLKVADDGINTLDERIAFLEAMNGENVKFCPLNHAAPGADHSADTIDMVLQILSPGKPYTVSILRYDYEIQLTDNNTVV